MNISLYVMSLIEGVYLYSTSSHRQGIEMSGTPKTFFLGAVKRCGKICDTLGGVFLGNHFSRKTLLRKEVWRKWLLFGSFFLTPNQPADFKCSKQPIIYSDSTSLVEVLEHVHGGELQTRFEIELICGESWCTSEDFTNNIIWLISSLFFGPKVSRHPFIFCLCYICFLLFFWDGVAQPLSWVWCFIFHPCIT